MKKLHVLFTILLMNTAQSVHSQTGELRGIVRDSITKEALPFANVAIMVDQTIFTAAAADENGSFKIKPLNAGAYKVQASFIGYNSKLIREVKINSNSTTELIFELNSDNLLPTPIIETWGEPLVDKYQFTVTNTLDAEEIQNSPAFSVQELAAGTASVVQDEETGSLHIRGGRDNATDYYIDGVKIIGRVSLPRRSIAKIEVITGGIPAQFGDVTGGIVLITTKSFLNR